MVKVKDLPDLTSNRIYPEPFLMCTGECGCTFSANSGDYFLYPKEHVFTCCGDPMSLMTKRVVYEEWSPKPKREPKSECEEVHAEVG
jgi:hypothetical protein